MKEISESIKVYVRQRPQLEFQEEIFSSGSNIASAIQQISEDGKTCTYVSTQNKMKQKFSVDNFFDTQSSQEELYDHVAKPIIESSLLGYSGLILAYGPTGSGKTHTMRGGDAESRGIIPRCIEEILNQSKYQKIELWASYLQIYCENVTDLLPSPNNNSTDSTNLNIREKPDGQGVYVEGLNKYQISNLQDLWEILSRGDENRFIASTNCNETSSRSHAILLLSILIFDNPADSTNSSSSSSSCKEGQLVLVDLAGSERAKASEGREYMRLEEAKAINLSLSALGNCMNALANGKGHIPYRDSKLTRLLSNSLNGKSRTSIITTIIPGPDTTGETLNTLRFASRATKVKVTATISQYYNYEELYKKAMERISLLEGQKSDSDDGAQLLLNGEKKTTNANEQRNGVSYDMLLQQLEEKNFQIEQQQLEIQLLKQQLAASTTSSTSSNVISGKSEEDDSNSYKMKYQQLQEEMYAKQQQLHTQYSQKITAYQQQLASKQQEYEALSQQFQTIQAEYLSQLTKFRVLNTEKQSLEETSSSRMQELLNELNEKQNTIDDCLIQIQTLEDMMRDEMVSQKDFRRMEEKFLSTIERLAQRVQSLEGQKRQSGQQPDTPPSGERIAIIEPGGRIRPTYPSNNNNNNASSSSSTKSAVPVSGNTKSSKKEDAVSSYFANLDAKVTLATGKKGHAASHTLLHPSGNTGSSMKYSASSNVL